MNWDRLQPRLIRAARRHPPGDQVPYAFEQRVMAALRTATSDPWLAIAQRLWWAAGACTAIAISIGVWTSLTDSPGDDFSLDLEQTILASADDGGVGIEIDWPR